ncbi:response regulator transcription factor [Marinomonas pontica]|uniref:response regulator transcription factor n=1 Tax=Marinomonas pontica TaxID=264739 RepID=UPI00224334F5|nr:response regulator transcription factor [Marinomonas pontica]MCW8357293.1 response regulator transcription factor [Marinomonas pontica]
MKILCWNTDSAVWKHWNQVISRGVSLVRVDTLEEVRQILSAKPSEFEYCFFYLDQEFFAKDVEDVASVCAELPQQKVVVFPSQHSQSAALRLFSVGVNGQCAPYIGKEQLTLVLSVIESGEIWGGKAFIQQLIQQSALPVAQPNSALDELSERELSVAQCVSKGLSNKQIALELNITERTVKAHLTSIFKKTQTKDRLALALLVKLQSVVH